LGTISVLLFITPPTQLKFPLSGSFEERRFGEESRNVGAGAATD
jgi:hypothetical protein